MFQEKHVAGKNLKSAGQRSDGDGQRHSGKGYAHDEDEKSVIGGRYREGVGKARPGIKARAMRVVSSASLSPSELTCKRKHWLVSISLGAAMR